MITKRYVKPVLSQWGEKSNWIQVFFSSSFSSYECSFSVSAFPALIFVTFLKVIFIGFAQITMTVSFNYLEPGPRALCRCHPHSRWSTGKSDVSSFSLSVRNHFLYLFSSSTLSLMSSLGRSVSKTEVVYYTRHALVFHSCLALTSAGDWRAVNLSPTLANNQVSVKLREK